MKEFKVNDFVSVTVEESAAGANRKKLVEGTIIEVRERDYLIELEGSIFRENEGWINKVYVPKFELEETNFTDQIFLLDSARGIFIPRDFAHAFNSSQIISNYEEVKELLSELSKGPVIENYWEIWEEVLNKVVLVDSSGEKYYLEHDMDLWAKNVKNKKEHEDKD